MAHHTIDLSAAAADRSRWLPRSTLMLGVGLSLLLWVAIAAAVVALR
jgi:hypothetical protein